MTVPPSARSDRDRRLQFALDDELQLLVDRELDGRAGGRLFEHAARQTRAARAAHHLDDLLAGFAGDPLLLRELDAGLAFVVDIDEAEHVRGGLAVRIVAMDRVVDAQRGLVERVDLRDFLVA